MATRIIQTIRTNKRYAIIAGSLAVCVGALLILQGHVVFDAVGRGASWLVGRTVRSVAYQNVSSDEEKQAAMPDRPAAQIAQVRLPADEVSPVIESEEPGMAPGAAAAAETAPPAVPEGMAADEAASEGVAPPVRADEPPAHKSFLSTFESYRSYGLRDPMVPLVVPGKGDEMESRFSVYNLTLVGLAWKGADRVALLEDKKGRSYLYRRGEMIADGARVIGIGDDSITFAMVRYGETTRLTLQLASKEEEN